MPKLALTPLHVPSFLCNRVRMRASVLVCFCAGVYVGVLCGYVSNQPRCDTSALRVSGAHLAEASRDAAVDAAGSGSQLGAAAASDGASRGTGEHPDELEAQLGEEGRKAIAEVKRLLLRAVERERERERERETRATSSSAGEGQGQQQSGTMSVGPADSLAVQLALSLTEALQAADDMAHAAAGSGSGGMGDRMREGAPAAVGGVPGVDGEGEGEVEGEQEDARALRRAAALMRLPALLPVEESLTVLSDEEQRTVANIETMIQEVRGGKGG